ncbi:DUF222 domain-containing protein [Georgenia yuyongxinii]|uniref:DUF222 domain-containing protein n=1 Tax=Georgenia yuyongxinii TaxID=2589797 RepID=A0A552WR09_9MICO|nr:DUF222 domain-containing protein [Georgenia yuyongxinii]TRW44883.1 DUF222 domain-containing protein [Georgenia yuyongxinii]
MSTMTAVPIAPPDNPPPPLSAVPPPPAGAISAPPGGPVPASDEVLVAELTTLAAHIAAATCRFLVLLGEFDARGTWEQPGILSPVHWLGWRCGMGPVAAREHVRVARALRDLPLTVSTFAEGRLSYSKVRAITRVATDRTEADLVDIALAAPAHHVERLVRGLRTAQSVEDVNRRHGRRSLSWRWADDGSLLISGRFSPEDGALIVQVLEDRREQAAAELAGAEPVEDDDGLVPDRPAGQIDPNTADRRSLADALVELCTEAQQPDSSRPRTSRAAETVVHVTLADLRTGGAVTSPSAEELAPASPGGTGVTKSTEEEDVQGVTGIAPQSLTAESVTTTPRLEDGPALHPETARRLACDAGIVVEVHEDGVDISGRTLEVGAKVRKPGAALIRAL